MKKISVVIPVYNSAEWLQVCLESVLGQTYSNLEVVVVDDGSTDRSMEMLQMYVQQNDKIKLIHHERNLGVGAARNTGLSYVTGDYVTFIDSDDEWMKEFCETLLSIIGDADIAVAGRATYVNGVFTKSKTAPSIEIVDTATAIQYVLQGKYSAHPVWGKLFKRELVEGVKFDEQYVFEDIRYSIDTMIQAKKVVFSDKDLYLYKMRGGSIMTANAERQISGYVHAAEYVYQRLLESSWINKCNYEFRVFLARGIIRNTRQFIRHDLDTDFFKKYDSRIVDLFESLGGL